MVLFDGAVDGQRDHPRTGARVGGWIVSITIFAMFLFALAPSPYVIEVPGPVFDTLGTVKIDGNEVELIEIVDEKTYPTSGSLDLLTVSTLGDPQSLPNWFDVVVAWFDPSKAVLPVDAVYPPGYSVEQVNEDGRIMMENSQRDAIAAALSQLHYDLPRVLTVGALTEDSAAEGILEPGDVLVSINGETADSVEGMRAIVAKVGAGNAVPIEVLRNGEPMTLTVYPKLSTEDPVVPLVGIIPSIDYTFPFEVKIQLENVGGPSGGQMFALGIIDKLTPGELNGGEVVAGTGTIDAEGKIGAIGGIRQKMYGAVRSGATWFLAPASNCDEVRGSVPAGLTVVAVSTLTESLAALEKIEAGEPAASLPSCSVR